MLPQSGVATAARLPIDIRRLPWIRPLAVDYVFAYERLAPFFAGDPRSSDAWRQAIARTQQHPRNRHGVADVVLAQQRHRNAPAEAQAAAAQLRTDNAVAIVTGQQAGLFGGPLFTLLKAITAIRLAADIQREHQVPAVPVFWIDAEDHDWEEVNHVGVLDPELAPHTITVGPLPGAGEAPVARVLLDNSIETALASLQDLLPPRDFTSELIDTLRAAYAPGHGMADAFARWLEAMLGQYGLVVCDAADPALKPLVAPLFAAEVEHAGRTARLAAEAGAALQAAGYHAQVAPHEGSTALFHINRGRHAIKGTGAGMQVGDATLSQAELIARIAQTPDAFSPNVLLRPIVQDTLFPTACYVAGPNELAYLAQLRGVYHAFGVPMPLMFQRVSATLVDSNAMRFLTKHEFPFESLRAQDEAALNQLLESQLPSGVESALTEATRLVDERMSALAGAVTQIDPTLEGAARSTLGRMQDDLKKLHNKIIQAAKRKDETLRRQYHHAQMLTFPGGHPQEREIGFVYFVNQYGRGLVERLNDSLPSEMGTHWVLSI